MDLFYCMVFLYILFVEIYIGRDKFFVFTVSSYFVYIMLVFGFYIIYLKYFVFFGIRIIIYE